MPKKGAKQYANPVREAIEKSSGRAMAGSRASASQRIMKDSQLAKQPVKQPTYKLGTDNFKRKVGARKQDTVSIRRVKKNDTFVTRHRADIKDPNTGFGMNVQSRIKHYKVTFS